MYMFKRVHAGGRGIRRISGGAFCYREVEGASEVHLPYVKLGIADNYHIFGTGQYVGQMYHQFADALCDPQGSSSNPIGSDEERNYEMRNIARMRGCGLGSHDGGGRGQRSGPVKMGSADI